jgi:hypothetical protein
MKKIEESELEEIGVPAPLTVVTEYFGKNGQQVFAKDQAFAFCSTVDGSPVYFIKYSRGELADPHNVSMTTSLAKRLATFKKVTSDTFKNYKKFLETKNTLYFTRARRNLM